MQSYHNNFEKSSLQKLHFGDTDTNYPEVLFTVLTFYNLITQHATLCCHCSYAAPIRVSLNSDRDVQHVRSWAVISYLLSPLRVCIFSRLDVGTNGVHYFRSMCIVLTG